MEKIFIKEDDVKQIVNNIVEEIVSERIIEGSTEIQRELLRVKQINSYALGHLKFIKNMLESNNPAHTKNFIIGYVNGVIKEIEYGTAISKGNGRPDDVISEDVNEALTYQEFKRGDKLSALRNAIDKNQTVSVVFVKRDGTVRPMAIRKHFNYEFKTGQNFAPTEHGFNTHKDFYNVFDINVYIKTKRQTGDSNLAAKSAWRKIILPNVLGFLAGGHFYDLREENNIQERFGPDIYGQLTKSMVNAAAKELSNANKSEQQSEPSEIQMGESASLKKKEQKKIDKVMGEFSKGKLKASYGDKVTDPKQALAIAYSEAGLSKKTNESIKAEGVLRHKPQHSVEVHGVERMISESGKTSVMKNKIYRALDKSNLTKGFFNDDSWQGVKSIVNLLSSIDGVIDVSCGSKNGGYRENKEGTKWKEYELQVDTVQGPIFGNLNAHAAGSVEDPFSRYDITVTLW